MAPAVGSMNQSLDLVHTGGLRFRRGHRAQPSTTHEPAPATHEPVLDIKKGAPGTASWMRVDSGGSLSVLEMDKNAIMTRAGIHARDLRILDPQLSYPSIILGREHAIVLNLEYLKAIITAEEVFLRNPNNEHVRHFAEELRRRILEPEAERQQQQQGQQQHPEQLQPGQGQGHPREQTGGEPHSGGVQQAGGALPGSHPVSIFDVANTGAQPPETPVHFPHDVAEAGVGTQGTGEFSHGSGGLSGSARKGSGGTPLAARSLLTSEISATGVAPGVQHLPSMQGPRAGHTHTGSHTGAGAGQTGRHIGAGAVYTHARSHTGVRAASYGATQSAAEAPGVLAHATLQVPGHASTPETSRGTDAAVPLLVRSHFQNGEELGYTQGPAESAAEDDRASDRGSVSSLPTRSGSGFEGMAAGFASLFSPQGRREAKAVRSEKEEDGAGGRTGGGSGSGSIFSPQGRREARERARAEREGAEDSGGFSRGTGSLGGSASRRGQRERERETRLSGSAEEGQSDTSEQGGMGLSAYGCAYPYGGDRSDEEEEEGEYGEGMEGEEEYDEDESDEGAGAGLGFDEGDGAGSYGDSASVRRRGSGAGTPLSSVANGGAGGGAGGGGADGAAGGTMIGQGVAAFGSLAEGQLYGDGAGEGETAAPPPFEFQALEVALECVCKLLERKTEELKKEAHEALDKLTSKVTSANLDGVRSMKNEMNQLISRVQKVREELEQLLDDDDDMAEMFLTRAAIAAAFTSPGPGIAQHPHHPSSVPDMGSAPGSPTVGSRVTSNAYHRGTLGSRASAYSSVHMDSSDVEELEQLLESYFVQVDGTLNELAKLREYIDDTEDFINIQIDNRRNRLIQLELVLNAGIMITSIMATIYGVFGVNIPFTWNQTSNAFLPVVLGTLGLCGVIFAVLMLYARVRGILL